MKRIFACLLACVIGFTMIFATGERAFADNIPDGFERALENESLILYINEETAEVALFDKSTRVTVFSNPQNRESDSVAAGTNRAKLGAQLSIEFYTPQSQLKTMDSFNDAVQFEQFEIDVSEGYVRVLYTLGEQKIDRTILPAMMSRERFETLLGRLDDSDASSLKRRFTYLTLEGKDASYAKELLERYPILEKHDVYTLKPIEDYLVPQIYAFFEKAGYTQADLEFDNADNGIVAEERESVQFTLVLEYRLLGKELDVSVNAAEIKGPDGYALSTVSLMEYFGAAGLDEAGYLFVPDGCGALINFNNGRLKSESFVTRVYGKDPATTQFPESPSEQCVLPVFGICRTEYAILASIVEGDPLAEICADISGRYNAQNYVYPRFTITARDDIDLGIGVSSGSVNAYQKPPYSGRLAVRYSIIGPERPGYAGMALAYRESLISLGILAERKDTSEDITLFAEFVGASEIQNSFIGIPYKTQMPLTTFKDLEQCTNELRELGIKNIDVKYSAWFNGGVYQQGVGSLKPLGVLGTSAEFEHMLLSLAENSVEFYPAASIIEVFGGNPKRDAARMLDKTPVSLSWLDIRTYRGRRDVKPYIILSPGKVPAFIELLKRELSKYGLSNVLLSDMGRVLTSDFTIDKTISRTESMEMMRQGLDLLNEAEKKYIVEIGNLYSLKNAEAVLNLPLDSSHYSIENETVPFLQIVLRGCIKFAGPSLNASRDRNALAMASLETGACLYTTFTARSAAKLKNTAHNSWFNTLFATSANETAELYSKLNALYKQIGDSAIADHAKYENGIAITTYANGLRVAVNSGRETAWVEGVNIDPGDFVVFGGGVA